MIGGVIVAGLTAYMAYRGASASWQYYLTADECLAESASLVGHRLRVSGRIAAGTLAVDRDRIAGFLRPGRRRGEPEGRLPGPVARQSGRRDRRAGRGPARRRRSPARREGVDPLCQQVRVAVCPPLRTAERPCTQKRSKREGNR